MGKKKIFGEKIQRFSFRKMSAGLASVAVSGLFLFANVTQPVLANNHVEDTAQVNETREITIHHRLFNHLTSDEQQALEYMEQYVVSEQDTEIVFVYQYKPVVNTLPSTGEASWIQPVMMVTGALVCVAVTKAFKQRRIVKYFLVTATGMSLLQTQAIYVQENDLYPTQNITAEIGEIITVPEALKENYRLIGVIRKSGDALVEEATLTENTENSQEQEAEQPAEETKEVEDVNTSDAAEPTTPIDDNNKETTSDESIVIPEPTQSEEVQEQEVGATESDVVDNSEEIEETKSDDSSPEPESESKPTESDEVTDSSVEQPEEESKEAEDVTPVTEDAEPSSDDSTVSEPVVTPTQPEENQEQESESTESDVAVETPKQDDVAPISDTSDEQVTPAETDATNEESSPEPVADSEPTESDEVTDSSAEQPEEESKEAEDVTSVTEDTETSSDESTVSEPVATPTQPEEKQEQESESTESEQPVEEHKEVETDSTSDTSDEQVTPAETDETKEESSPEPVAESESKPTESDEVTDSSAEQPEEESKEAEDGNTSDAAEPITPIADNNKETTSDESVVMPEPTQSEETQEVGSTEPDVVDNSEEVEKTKSDDSSPEPVAESESKPTESDEVTDSSVEQPEEESKEAEDVTPVTEDAEPSSDDSTVSEPVVTPTQPEEKQEQESESTESEQPVEEHKEVETDSTSDTSDEQVTPAETDETKEEETTDSVSTEDSQENPETDVVAEESKQDDTEATSSDDSTVSEPVETPTQPEEKQEQESELTESEQPAEESKEVETDSTSDTSDEQVTPAETDETKEEETTDPVSTEDSQENPETDVVAEESKQDDTEATSSDDSTVSEPVETPMQPEENQEQESASTEPDVVAEDSKQDEVDSTSDINEEQVASSEDDKTKEEDATNPVETLEQTSPEESEASKEQEEVVDTPVTEDETSVGEETTEDNESLDSTVDSEPVSVEDPQKEQESEPTTSDETADDSKQDEVDPTSDINEEQVASSEEETPKVDENVEPVVESEQNTVEEPEKQEEQEEEEIKEPRVEIKRISSVTLYKNDGTKVESLASAPVSPAHYVAIQSDDNKTVYLPVLRFEQDGKGIKAYVSLADSVVRTDGERKEGNEDFVYVSAKSGTLQDLNKRDLGDTSIAYRNMEKLLPFYDVETITRYSALLTGNLATKTLLDVVPMTNDGFALDLQADKDKIEKLFLHFDNQEKDVVELKKQGENTSHNTIVEYMFDLDGKQILYTPESLATNNDSVIAETSAKLNAINYDSREVAVALDRTGAYELQDKSTWQRILKTLYLEDSFNTVKENIDTHLKKLLATEGVFASDDAKKAYLKQIQEKPAEFLLGLAYMQRWYNVNYGEDYNIQDLVTYKTDFFGNQGLSARDTLIKLGDARKNFSQIRPDMAWTTYETFVKPHTGLEDLQQYLEANRKLFLPDQTNGQWFKANTKAYVVEQQSSITEVAAKQQDPASQGTRYAISVYDKLVAPQVEDDNQVSETIHYQKVDRDRLMKRNRRLLLPLLTLPEEKVYVISTMSSLSFGSYERYDDKSDAQIQEMVRQTAERQANFFDFWYNILDANGKDQLYRTAMNLDGFWINGNWADNTSDISSIKHFFGPTQLWYSKAKGQNNGNNGAYAVYEDEASHFEQHKALTEEGAVTFTHELTHVLDYQVFLGGYGRREGMGAESFAMGMFETLKPQEERLGINNIFTDIISSYNTNRYHALNPLERFKTADDLQDYMKKQFDVLYLLEYLEGEAILSLETSDAKQKWLRKIENSGTGSRLVNRITSLDSNAINALKTVDDLIDHSILSFHDFVALERLTYGKNDYIKLNLLYPIWSALDNPTGAPGGLMFRRMAFELLAEKGYYEGMLPYISNKVNPNATMAEVGDTEIFKAIFGETYSTWAEFKKDMFQQRITEAETFLRPLTINYDKTKSFGAPSVTINNLAELRALMKEAVEHDTKRSRFSTTSTDRLKSLIYQAYLQDTNDFRESIFKEENALN